MYYGNPPTQYTLEYMKVQVNANGTATSTFKGCGANPQLDNGAWAYKPNTSPREYDAGTATYFMNADNSAWAVVKEGTTYSWSKTQHIFTGCP
jgi:hypothetical protein